ARRGPVTWYFADSMRSSSVPTGGVGAEEGSGRFVLDRPPVRAGRGLAGGAAFVRADATLATRRAVAFFGAVFRACPFRTKTPFGSASLGALEREAGEPLRATGDDLFSRVVRGARFPAPVPASVLGFRGTGRV
ncbi:MAG TPA: hypothetical protein VIC87_13365, partial [Vicinamibacteria bacterium]